MTHRIRIIDDQGKPLPCSVVLVFEDRQEERAELECLVGEDGLLVFDPSEVAGPGAVMVRPLVPGFWRVAIEDFLAVDTIVCPRLDHNGVRSWWHAPLGEAAIGDGSGIGIGVIDAAFRPEADLGHIVWWAGEEVPEPSEDVPWHHGEAVCRILSDRSAPADCAPFAPNARVIFIPADRAPLEPAEDYLFPMSEQGVQLDPRLVADAIYRLALSGEVNLINLSAGVHGYYTAGLHEAIRVANRRGVLVICAAGNEPNGVAFPASLKEAVAVGAYGPCEFGPEDGMIGYYADRAQNMGDLADDPVGHWVVSASGPHLDVIAPGVGVVIAQAGTPAYDLYGTSFAAPIVTGVLASALAQDSGYFNRPADASRTDYARRRLHKMCVSTGIGTEFEGRGVPIWASTGL